MRSTAVGGSPSAGWSRGTWKDMERGEQLSAIPALTHHSQSSACLPFRSHNSCPLMTHKPMIDINRHANRHSPGVGKEAGGRNKDGFMSSLCPEDGCNSKHRSRILCFPHTLDVTPVNALHCGGMVPDSWLWLRLLEGHGGWSSSGQQLHTSQPPCDVKRLVVLRCGSIP